MSERPRTITAANWRVGGKVPLNVYHHDRPMFQCHTPEDAGRIVHLLNQRDSSEQTIRANEQERCAKVAKEAEHFIYCNHVECQCGRIAAAMRRGPETGAASEAQAPAGQPTQAHVDDLVSHCDVLSKRWDQERELADKLAKALEAMVLCSFSGIEDPTVGSAEAALAQHTAMRIGKWMEK